MIHGACERLCDRGFHQIQQVEDEYGTVGYVLSFMGDRYCLVAKEYAYDDLASFMAWLVETAPKDLKFIFYCHDDRSHTVFDGEYLRTHADPSQGPSKKRDCSWREIPRSTGADLDQYIRGESSPTTLAGANDTLSNFA